MKKNELNLLYILLFMSLYGCSVPKFYSEINEMQNDIKYETEKNIDNAIEIKSKSNDVNKLVFKKLKKELVNSNHIIYFNHPSSSLIEKKYWFVVYDIDNQIYYELESSETNKKRIELIKRSDTLTNNYYRYILNNYINDKCDILKQKGNTKLSGVRTYEAIYEVNLESKENRSCYFRNFLYLE